MNLHLAWQAKNMRKALGACLKSSKQKGHSVLKNAHRFRTIIPSIVASQAAPSVQVRLRLSIPLTNRPIKVRPPTQPYETGPATVHEMDAELLSSAGSASIQKLCLKEKKKGVAVFKAGRENTRETPWHISHPLGYQRSRITK